VFLALVAAIGWMALNWAILDVLWPYIGADES
jgi:hypothetical protein